MFKYKGPTFFNTVYLRQGLTEITPVYSSLLELTNDLIDGGQPRAKPKLCKVKPNHVLKTIFSPRLATIYIESLVNPRVYLDLI